MSSNHERCRRVSRGLVLILVQLAAVGFLSCQEVAQAALAPLPEGDKGIAAKYLGDFDLDKDPAVVFADGFESDNSGWDNGWGARVFQTKPELVHGGKKSLEMTMINPPPGGESGQGVSHHLQQAGYDVLFMRAYVRFEKTFDMLGHNHCSISLAAKAAGVPDATPGIPSDGRSSFGGVLEPERSDESWSAPGAWNIYMYHPEQRSQWGDHWYPTGRIAPQPTPGHPVDLFGPSFVPRPLVVSERERWICIEIMMKANTPGKLDGRIAFWIDGRLAADFVNLRLRDVPELKLNRISIGMSTHSSQYTNPNTVWYDDVVVATSYIGPMYFGKKHGKPEAKDKSETPVVEVKKPELPTVDAKVLAEWNANLIKRVEQGVKDGAHPVTVMRVGGTKEERVQVDSASKTSLGVQLEGTVFPVPWSWLSPSEQLNLASAFLQPDQCDDHLLVAVFAHINGKAALAEQHFARAKIADPVAGADRVKEIRQSLGLP